ncbi:MAG: DivIVA domain-containing protein [Clostridia bacterium]|nr:DivIVA domain-containing protein [Clostridia bacterium]
MLTLEEIENISFRKAGLGGYKTDDVDTFVDGVILKVKDLEIANKELESRIEQLNEKIQKYKEKEESVQDAIITAEMTAKSLVREATHKSEVMLTDAKTKADNILKEASEKAEKTLSESNQKADTVINNAMMQSARKIDENNKTIENQKHLIIQIQDEVTKFRDALIASYKNHLKIIDSLPKAEEFKRYQQKLDECYPTSAPAVPVKNVENNAENSDDTVKKTTDEKKTESEKQSDVTEEKTETQSEQPLTEEKDTEIFSSSKAEHDFKSHTDAKTTDDEAEDMPSENKREPIKFGVLKLDDIDDNAEKSK